jgi:hypothetical protein
MGIFFICSGSDTIFAMFFSSPQNHLANQFGKHWHRDPFMATECNEVSGISYSHTAMLITQEDSNKKKFLLKIKGGRQFNFLEIINRLHSL